MKGGLLKAKSLMGDNLSDIEIAIIGIVVVWLFTSLFVGRTVGFVLTFSAAVIMLAAAVPGIIDPKWHTDRKVQHLKKQRDRITKTISHLESTVAAG